MVKMTASAELAETLRVITAAAPGLRKAGVTRLQIGPLQLDIDPPLPEAPSPRREEPDANFLDPSTFRRAEGDIDQDGEP